MPKMMNRSHPLQSLLLLPLLAFSLVSLYYLVFHHVSPLSRDQWHMYAPYFEHGFWQTMLSPMSTHRHIFPFFLFHLDMVLFNGLNHFLVACGAFFNGLIIYLLLKNLSREKSLTSIEKLCLGIFIVTEMIWLLNIAQLGWGFMSTQYYLAIFTFLLAIYSAYQFMDNLECPRWIALSISCGVISTFSFGMGILVWPCLLYFIWLWRAPLNFLLLVIAAFFICLFLFFMLPGGNDIEETLLFLPMETIRFTTQLAGGPVFFLLRSWRFFDIESCKQIASVIGIIASISGMAMLTLTAWHRPTFPAFRQLCYALVFLGLGTAALISVTRAPNFLDVWVDRYQIWGALFWTGFLPLLYFRLKTFSFRLSRTFIILLSCLPLFAFPSQLDMGSRLYEYKVRVQEALLFYQVGIPDKKAAQDALHWNWENKLPFFFFVLEELKKNRKNIYHQNPEKYLGLSLQHLSENWKIIPLSLNAGKIQPFDQNELLDARQFPALEKFPSYLPEKYTGIAGYKVTANIPDDITWKYAVSVNDKNIINGLGIHIHHSRLPRPDRAFTKRNYNFYAVVRYEKNPNVRWYLVSPYASSK